jgi:hypothetical protein
VLVQRSALDLLMVCFPMHNNQLLYADMVRLVTAALSTILRRDMSLNRYVDQQMKVIQGLPELADQNNTVKSLSSGNNRKNI